MKLKAVRNKRRKWWRRRAALLLPVMLLILYIHAGDVIEAGGSVRWSGYDRAVGPVIVQEVVDGNRQAAAGNAAGGLDLALADRQAGAEWSAEEQKEIYRRLAAGELVTDRGNQPSRIPDKPTVYLTFDDGPSGLTPNVLDILAEENVKATFFVLGSLVERYPDATKRIVDEGHAIGNHSYDHVYERLYTDFAEFFKQVTLTDEIIWRTTGVRTPLFRAPGGTYRHFDPFYSYYMEQAGYAVYDWDVDSGDSRRKDVTASEIIANITGATLKHEMIVLLHDGGGHEETVQALPEIIRHFKRLGYQFAALDDSVEPRQFTLGSLKWKRSMSWQEHVQNMEWVAAFRSTRESIHEAPVNEERLMLMVNGQRYVLESEDFYVLDGHYQVKLARLAKVLGAGLIKRAAACCVNPPFLMNGGGLAYEQPDSWGMTGHLSGERLQTALLALATVKDGRLYLPLRKTVEMLGGSISSYGLGRDVREIQVRI